MLFLLANKAKDMPTPEAGKLLNLGAPRYLVAGNAALMRAVPCCVPIARELGNPSNLPYPRRSRLCGGAHLSAAATRQTGHRTEISKPVLAVVVDYVFEESS